MLVIILDFVSVYCLSIADFPICSRFIIHWYYQLQYVRFFCPLHIQILTYLPKGLPSLPYIILKVIHPKSIFPMVGSVCWSLWPLAHLGLPKSLNLFRFADARPTLSTMYTHSEMWRVTHTALKRRGSYICPLFSCLLKSEMPADF